MNDTPNNIRVAFHFLKNITEGIVEHPVDVLYESYENNVSFMIVPHQKKHYGILIGLGGSNANAIRRVFQIWSDAHARPLHWKLTIANPDMIKTFV